MTRPQKLPDDLIGIKRAGVNTVASLLEREEAAGVGLGDEAAVCAALGLAFLSHPIRDMHLPEPVRFKVFCAEIADRIKLGESIAVHCHASIGRSGMLVCAVLGRFGYTADEALLLTSERRGAPVPDTPEQTAFIHAIMGASLV